MTLTNLTNRLVYAIKTHIGFPKELWKKVLFSDEKTIQGYPDGISFVHRLKNERYLLKNIVQRETQSRVKVNLFGVISYNGPNDIYFVSNNFTSIQHLDLLYDSGIIETIFRRKLIYQQDNAKIHNSFKRFAQRINESPLMENKITLLNHPAKSPDLNPIENVWAELQRRVNIEMRFKTVSSVPELKELVLKCWREIPQEFIRNQILSMPKRVKEVFDNYGEISHY